MLFVILVSSCDREVTIRSETGASLVPMPVSALPPLGSSLHAPDTGKFVVEVSPGTDIAPIVDALGVTVIGAEEFSTNAIVLLQGSPTLSPDDFESFSGVQSAGRNDAADVFAESSSLVIGFVDWGWSDSSGSGQDAFAGLDLGTAHGLATGAGVRIGVVDTGADPSHPLLSSRLDLLPAGTMESVETCDGLDDDGDGEIDEGCSHGTFVAGELAICSPGATIVPCRALNSDGVGSVVDIIRGMLVLADDGCQVLNLSLSLSDADGQFEKVLQELHARGIVVVASAGNAGLSHPLFPGTSPHVVGAAAVDPSGTIASFSGGGPQIDLGAPGVGVTSAFLGGGTGVASGSSMAAPVVAATIALVMEELELSPIAAAIHTRTYTGAIAPSEATALGTVSPVDALTH
jgi:subtilisin family serine protease